MATFGNWTWFVGMLIFSNAMHVLGLLGAPRRTELGEAPYVPDEWSGHLFRMSVGGAILLVGVIVFVLIAARTAWQKQTARPRVSTSSSRWPSRCDIRR